MSKKFDTILHCKDCEMVTKYICNAECQCTRWNCSVLNSTVDGNWLCVIDRDFERAKDLRNRKNKMIKKKGGK